MEEPRIDPRCSGAVLVLSRPCLLPKGRTGIGRSFLQVLLLNKVSLSLAMLLCVSACKSPTWAKQEAGTCELYKGAV